MRRLITSDRPSERGAVAVIVAILAVVLIGFAAISVDVGASYLQRSRMQNGVDAAALGVANDCSKSTTAVPTCASADNQTIANGLVTRNGAADTIDTPVVSVTSSGSTGTVVVTAHGVKQHWFGGVLGLNYFDINTKAKATWSTPSAADVPVPWAISYCDWKTATNNGSSYVAAPFGASSGTAQATMYHVNYQAASQSNSGNSTTCNYPTDATTLKTKYGFTWLSGSCTSALVTTRKQQVSLQASGFAVPSPGNCASSLPSYLRKIVPVPIIKANPDTSASQSYVIIGYAAFTLKVFCVPGASPPQQGSLTYNGSAPSPTCNANTSYIQGDFVKAPLPTTTQTSQSDTGSYDSFGATSVSLAAS